MVAVGTRISPRPPHRSRRALLTHRAPPSGSGVEAVTRQRVYRSDWRKEAGDELDEPLPAEACRLAAPLERSSSEDQTNAEKGQIGDQHAHTQRYHWQTPACSPAKG